jgi:GNAT superfamily N-acetyltransferase
MNIVNLSPTLASQVAQLHKMGIYLGFLSSMGIPFLTLLYKTIATDSSSFCFVAVEKEQVLGFVAFTENLGKLYKKFLKANTISLLPVFVRQLFSWRKIKGIAQNLLYPRRTKKLELPQMALISIAVAEEARKQGIATRLIEAGFQECRRRGHDKVRVLAAEVYLPANALYMKCGFRETLRITRHGMPSRFYVADLNQIRGKDYSPAVSMTAKPKTLQNRPAVLRKRGRIF